MNIINCSVLNKTSSIFLAGPTPRSPEVSSWRPEALDILKVMGYKSDVFIPEIFEGSERMTLPYKDQIEWERYHLNRAECILFWIPRDLKELPGFTTNIEFGEWLHSGKIVVGAPKDASKMKYIKEKCSYHNIPFSNYLEGTVAAALDILKVS